MNTDKSSEQSGHQLRRDITLGGAVMLGLGSIVGTGVFVSIGVAAGVAGSNVLIAIVIASLVATCNGLSSAQLAALHPVSGGTYEYGYHWLTPAAGFSAGWLFLCAKSASAATAALGLAGYIQMATGIAVGQVSLVIPALLALFLLTCVVLTGIRRTTLVNTCIVAITLVALALFVCVGFLPAIQRAPENLQGIFNFADGGWTAMLSASALMFVAYTGYGRIATLGEEVAEPHRTIPRAMIMTLVVTLLVYLSVSFVAIANVGAERLGEETLQTAAPLLYVARQLNSPVVVTMLSIGAITAMLGVMLNLVLGLSRVVLAMSRRADAPRSFALINVRGVPAPATVVVAVIIGSLICIGDIKLSWSFSAFTVLVYYALTNLCALRIPPSDRLFPIWPAWCGLVSCVSLALFIDPPIMVAGLLVLAVGLVYRAVFRRVAERKTGDA